MLNKFTVIVSRVAMLTMNNAQRMKTVIANCRQVSHRVMMMMMMMVMVMTVMVTSLPCRQFAATSLEIHLSIILVISISCSIVIDLAVQLHSNILLVHFGRSPCFTARVLLTRSVVYAIGPLLFA